MRGPLASAAPLVEIVKDLDVLTKVLQLDHVLLQFKCTKPLTGPVERSSDLFYALSA